MMKRLIFMAAATTLMAGVQAQLYGALGYTSTTAKASDNLGTYKASPKAIRGIVGYEAHPNLAVEGMLALGMGDAGISGPGVPSGANLKIQNAYGLYLKPKAKLNDALELFGRVGYTKAKYKSSYRASSFKESDDSLSYGLGLSYALTSNVYLNLDYLQYIKEKDSKTTGTTFGIGYRF